MSTAAMVKRMTYAELVAAEDSQSRACSNGQGSWDYLREISQELARRRSLGLQYVPDYRGEAK